MKDVRKEAIAQCERDGEVFVERNTSSQGGMFGTVSVSGECIDPGEEGYAEALAKARAETEAKPKAK